ncbi:tryptophan 5-hydroxylase 1 [Contarinia nasturtii]|uniref:tryptophan 5-hydroxylase 1 n=1 Tax=Contarinia nasturtii TaxID=265458 RepID=UPI0012D3B97E|nr:tryptophan 5-hydroxylase 1 [Contarinia nasturtii]XP_031630355.1 tryptophan 5-hydroxylase 1 [Contarinia nasturtii]XP_031630356.1 tryptophan 5-hydroxylase 1 [Contarinia nasturtii]XP_031630357.1 tryptophan 5-hydroxylase 1 [Contarinia nasturtii]XP_031630358.1 tryptophan 5-hydroxylase 1 [Contarinia nasturtii]XP_031630359.1 tryptophan 5-hydroxylase 1 [Contarinia nasturtii]
MSGSGKGLLGLWLYRSGEQEWAVKEGSPLHNQDDLVTSSVPNERLKRQDNISPVDKTSIIFTLNNQVGGLARALQVFQELGINVLHLELQNTRSDVDQAEVFVDIECDPKHLEKVIRLLKREVSSVNFASPQVSDEFPPPTPLSACSSFDFGDIYWFPRKISDLDKVQNVLMYGTELDADHPGFKDPVYRKRREEFAAIANSYKHGNPIPKIQYTPEEIKTWGVVFRELHRLYTLHAVPEYMENWPQLVKYCGYREDNLPQLQDVSNFLKRKTGFQLRPVAGYLSPRDFLSGLAFRVFHCTQYIRHSSDPFYTPEPDCCHELLGHMPLLANASFAQFSQEIGLASLGASDSDIDKLATLYFFTVEFGLCRQIDGSFKVYGAGLLSSVAELQHALGTTDKIKRFDPEITCQEECIITSYQNAYYYTDSFEEAKDRMRIYAENIQRPFGVKYNPYTQTVDVLSNAKRITAAVSELRGDLSIVSSALRKVSALDQDLDVEKITQMLQSGLQVGDRSPVSPDSDGSQDGTNKSNNNIDDSKE